jgi:hypothetical protein
VDITDTTLVSNGSVTLKLTVDRSKVLTAEATASFSVEGNGDSQPITVHVTK